MSDVIDAEDLIRELSPTVGEEMARKSVVAVLAELGIDANRVLTPAERNATLAALGKEPGLVGLAATVLGHRLRLTRGAESSKEAAKEAPKPPPAPSGQQRPSRATGVEQLREPDVPVSLLVAHMAGTIGVEKAEDLVGKAAARLGLASTGILSWEDCERLIDVIALEPGVVGLAAKVTKQKLRMRMAPLPVR